MTRHDADRPRVLILTARRWCRDLSHTIVLDFEDAMAQMAEVTWCHLPADALSARARPTRHRIQPPPEPYDLAFFVAMAPTWMRALRGVRDIRRSARRFAVYVFDAWAYQTRSLLRYRRQFSQVDHLFVAYPEAVSIYAPRLRCDVSYLVQGTSPERFRPDREERRIDFLSLGRRHAGAHRRLLELAGRDDLLYLFSDRATSTSIDLEDSRRLTSALCCSSRVQVSWPVELTSPDRAGGFSPVTARWFEAAASGSAVLGRRPRSPTFDELFPYDGFVRDVDPDGQDFERAAIETLAPHDRAERLSLAAHVRSEHSWRRRCEAILERALQ